MSVWSATAKVQLTTYYPAPFGDYERIRSNTFEFIGMSRGSLISGERDIEKGVTLITDLNLIRFYRGLRVLGEFVAPDSDVDRTLQPLALYADYEWNKILFKSKGQGVFFNNPQNALFFYQTNESQEQLRPDGSRGPVDVAQSNLGVRAQNNIILHPGSPDDSVYDSYQPVTTEKNSVFCNGNFIVKGAVKVKSASSNDTLFEIDENGRILMTAPCEVRNSSGNTVFSINDDGDVNVTGKLIVGGSLDVLGSFNAFKSVFNFLRVTHHLAVQTDEELAAERSELSSVSLKPLWDSVHRLTYQTFQTEMGRAIKKPLYKESSAVFTDARFKGILKLESDKERKRRKEDSDNGITQSKAGWTWTDLSSSHRSQIQIFGDLITKSIQSPFPDRFEVRISPGDHTIARFFKGRLGSRHPALEVPGEVVGRGNAGRHYI